MTNNIFPIDEAKVARRAAFKIYKEKSGGRVDRIGSGGAANFTIDPLGDEGPEIEDHDLDMPNINLLGAKLWRP